MGPTFILWVEDNDTLERLCDTFTVDFPGGVLITVSFVDFPAIVNYVRLGMWLSVLCKQTFLQTSYRASRHSSLYRRRL